MAQLDLTLLGMGEDGHVASLRQTVRHTLSTVARNPGTAQKKVASFSKRSNEETC